jgi:hypothetical protein
VQEKPVMVLDFNSLQRPEISLIIDTIKIDNILFDTGSYSSLSLLAEDIQQINRVVTLQGKDSVFSSGLYTDSICNNVFTYNYININGLSIDSLMIYQSSVRQIGMGFIKKFNQFFFDSKNKQIRFYK